MNPCALYASQIVAHRTATPSGSVNHQLSMRSGTSACPAFITPRNRSAKAPAMATKNAFTARKARTDFTDARIHP